VRVAARDIDGDGEVELLTGSGTGSPSRVSVYRASRIVNLQTPTEFDTLAPFGENDLNGVFVG
jgi:hypothetical protein